MTKNCLYDIISLNNKISLFKEMIYLSFKNKIKKFPIFSSSQIASFTDNKQVIRNQLSFWLKKELIIKLKKGLYVLNEEDREINISRLFIANQLMTPSYISLEYALSYYDLIPEGVAEINSVTPRKTSLYRNNFGVFRYQHIKNTSFTGFGQINDENNMKIFIAQPEKAVVDFLYFKLPLIKVNDREIFEQSFRFQGLEILNKKKLSYFSKLFNNKKLVHVVKNMREII